MAVPPIDFSALPPEGSSRPGGPGLEAAANRYIERMRREAQEKGQAPQEENGDKKPQADVDTASLATATTQGTKADSIVSESSKKPLVSPSGKGNERRRSFWESMKGGWGGSKAADK